MRERVEEEEGVQKEEGCDGKRYYNNVCTRNFVGVSMPRIGTM